jgi:hypothetical protein
MLLALAGGLGGATESYHPYVDYDASAGHPFDLGLYHHWVDGVQETDADVSVAPIFSGYYEYAELWSFGVPVPDDVWRQFTNLGDGLTVKLRKDWLVANNEIGNGVLFTNPLTTTDLNIDSMIDIRVPLTVTDLVKPLTANPWSSDWMDWVRTELNLDTPLGTNGVRPSQWFSQIGQSRYSNETWWVGINGGSYKRNLKSRRKRRYERINAHLWTGVPGADKQEVTYDWLIATRANLPIELTRDDPDWWSAANGWLPVGSYHTGRIDIYEGVDCSGQCDHFGQRFFEQKFGVEFSEVWFSSSLGAQFGALPDDVYIHWLSEGDPLPGDMMFLRADGSSVWHVGIVHSVEGGEIYLANSNHDSGGGGDELGYFDTVSSLGMISVCYMRYQPGMAIEDVTDYRGMSCQRMRFSGATQDIPVNLTITYQLVYPWSPWYTSGEWNFGSSGTAAAVLGGELTRVVSSTLQASDGVVVFDFAPDVGERYRDLELVESIEVEFGSVDVAQELTFLGWETIPYPNETYVPGTGIAMDRIALKFSTDYFGARLAVDGMPNYKPTYGYTLDTERAEVGFKHTQDLQLPPDSLYEGPITDWRSLKALSTMAGEMVLAETLYTPVWNQSSVDAVLMDVDDVTLAAPLWGDYDEDGYCLHVGKVIGDTFPVAIHYADFILQGGTRGIAKVNGVRQVNQPDDTIELLYSEDGGGTKVSIRACGTDYVGAFNIGTGREKAPRTYYLVLNGQEYALGSFVNVEEVYALVAALQGIPLYTHIDRWGNMYTLYTDGTQVKAKVTRHLSTQEVKTITIADAAQEIISVWIGESKDVLYAGAELLDGTFKRWKSAACDLLGFEEG